MRKSLLLNALIAILWILLSKHHSLLDFLFGYLAGFAFLALFPSLLGSHEYVRRTIALFRFQVHFLWVFLKANVTVAYQVLFVPRKQIVGRFITLDIGTLSHLETIYYAHLITLTPGTTSVDFVEEPKQLRVHTLGTRDNPIDPHEIERDILIPLQRFTR